MSETRNVTTLPITAGTVVVFKNTKTHAVIGGTTIAEDCTIEIQVPHIDHPVRRKARR